MGETAAPVPRAGPAFPGDAGDSILPHSLRAHPQEIMDPRYCSLFQHVLPLFWPWLWWNLLRLDAYRRRVNRNILIQTDRMGNIRILLVGDAPKPDDLYCYKPPKVASWDRLAPGFCVPVTTLELPARLQAFAPRVRAPSGPASGTGALVRGPP